MPARVVVLGGGVGGTLAANLLDKSLGRDVHVTVVDPTGMHDYQPGYLYVALGEASGHWLSRDERTLLRKGVDLAIERAVRIHPDAQTVQLERGGSLEWDYLVIATGARLVHDAIPGLVEGSYGFYSLNDAERLREALRRFRGGRVRVGIAGIPYKCPPAPVEFTFMVEEYLRKRGIRDRSEVTLLSPLNRAFTIESASKLIQPIMDKRGIELTTFFNVEAVDPSAGTVESLEGEKVEYDLLVLVPPHKGQQVVIDSELGDPSGWLPTDRFTLQVGEHERIFALGDATNLPISKSGSTAHFEAPVIASRIASLVRGSAPKKNYGGRVMCFLETGDGKATALRFDYEHPPVPPQPNRAWHMAKWIFNRAYWETVPRGRLPEWAPGTKPKGTKEEER
jgi:sulfide:quinone oxidoreductase